MRPRLIAPALVLVTSSLFASCSGDSTPSFEDPLTAMDYAEASMAENKFEEAITAYEYVLANGDDSLSADCLEGIYSAQTRAGQEDLAIATFERLCKQQAEAFAGQPMIGLLDQAITSKMADLAEVVMIYAYRNHPELAPDLIIPSAQIASIRMESIGNDAAMAELGYVGGDTMTEIKEEDLQVHLDRLDEFIRIIEQQRGLAADSSTSK